MLLNVGFIVLTLTIAFNHTVAVIAHIAKELDSREVRIAVYTPSKTFIV